MNKSITKNFLLFLVVGYLVLLSGCGNGEELKDFENEQDIIEQEIEHENFEEEDEIPQQIDEQEEKEAFLPLIDNEHKKRVKARGLYLTASSAAGRLGYYIDIANTTEVNSYVIDVKNDYGIVMYDSKVPLAGEIGAKNIMLDLENVTNRLRENDIYSIARIVVFKDPILAKAKPDLAIKKPDGTLYRFNNSYWIDPYKEKTWEYNVDIAKEVLALGFDEVQFDYVRFPDGRRSDMNFEDTRGGRSFSENINDFLEYARLQMPNDVLSADIFAIVAQSPGDTEGIGQHLETVGRDMDYICLMAYPSHYAPGQIINGVRFDKPDLEPYGIIKNTLLRTKERLSKVEGRTPRVRTYLQDFTATWIGDYQHYGPEQLRQQIQAVYDAGYEQWLVWDHMNSYSVDGLEKR